MKGHRFILILVAAFFMLAAAACNFPITASPTPFVFPTPNLTLTAVFNPTQPSAPTALPTATAGPGNPTATQPPAQTTAPTATAQAPSATPTTVPTNTPAPATPMPPTATQPPPASRPNFRVQALYVDDPIEIDGEMDDWDLDRIEIDEVVFGDDRWSDTDDLSGRGMLAWDEDYLYLSVRVWDDEYVQNARTSELFKGDSLEILIDANVQADYFVRSLSPDDFQLGISPGSPGPGDDPEAYLWFPAAIAGRRSEVVIGAESVDAGYYVEAAIPWDVFEINPDEGDHYGFALSISDNDRAEENVQQSMVSNVTTRALTDPTTWGDLELID
jgi:hypothetical protein